MCIRDSPNDARDPTRSPAWSEQTTFLATRGVTDYATVYCHAADMVRTRVGFVLSSYVTVANVSYQGVDVIRPDDNGALCGGGAFETKGCAENDCSTAVNNGGSDGLGSVHTTKHTGSRPSWRTLRFRRSACSRNFLQSSTRLACVASLGLPSRERF